MRFRIFYFRFNHSHENGGSWWDNFYLSDKYFESTNHKLFIFMCILLCIAIIALVLFLSYRAVIRYSNNLKLLKSDLLNFPKTIMVGILSSPLLVMASIVGGLVMVASFLI